MKTRDYNILMFDLDGTLLTSEKTISEKTARAIDKCKAQGWKIGVCTSRSEQNSLTFIDKIQPDVIISSGGALVKADGVYIFKSEFSAVETEAIIRKFRQIAGGDCEITAETAEAHYWNYKVNPSTIEANWGESIFCDFSDFHEPTLKLCVEIKDEGRADEFYRCFGEYDCIKFSDGDWYKVTKKNITKENAIRIAVSHYGYGLQEVISFGDDFADIGMLRMTGLGVAMGNAIDEVKANADLVIGTNDEDGIAGFLDGL